jgi:uncharacterized integral membrane protein (TIGR00698 family)
MKYQHRRMAAARLIVPLGALLCFLPWVSSAIGLMLGMALAMLLGNPYLSQTRRWTSRLLAWAVIGLGAGMDLRVIGQVGAQGLIYTVVGISFTLACGLWLGRLLKIEGNTGLLIAVGTAICGGSAIAAAAPVLRAKSHEVSVALGTVFLLNAAALFIFPWVGQALQLSASQFGFWSALAIHDTSSVVGATLQYGQEALAVGTTVKLARALWIVPVTVMIGVLAARVRHETSAEKAQTKKPWFILGFVAMAALFTFFPVLAPAGHAIEVCAKRLMVVTLFLIGSNLTYDTARSVGIRPFMQGVFLWLIVASATLQAIKVGWIP